MSTRLQLKQTGNKLLDRLPAAELKPVAAELELLHLPIQAVLCRADDRLEHVYFPVTAVLSLLMPPSPESSKSIEIGCVGNEGIAGFTALLGVPTSFHLTTCHVPGDCLRLPVGCLAKAMSRSPVLDRLFRKYMAIAYRTVVQAAVCNVLHQAEQRVCRWLLVAHDKAAGEVPATQDSLAARLGVKRPTVSLIANALQKDGLIAYHRGAVRVLDRDKLEQRACDCFKITKAIYDRVLDSDSRTRPPS